MTINFRELAAPFERKDVKTRVVGGGRKADYITARQVMNRLDAIVGPANWRDEYHVLPSGAVVCTLFLRIGDEWIGKTDVGTESSQEPEKGAFSDALKRAAVRWGIGRELYHDGTAFDDDTPPPTPPARQPQKRTSAPARKSQPRTPRGADRQRTQDDPPRDSMTDELPAAAQDDMFPKIARVWPSVARSLYNEPVSSLADKGIQVGAIVYPAIGELGYADEHAVKSALNVSSITTFDGTLEQLLNAVIELSPAA